MHLLRILALCLSAALICAAIRAAHPQIAMAVALGCGAAVMLLSLEDMSVFADALRKLDDLSGSAEVGGVQLIRVCGVAMVAEFASDICRDAGESALARRIDVGIRLGVAAAALPAASRIMENIAGLLA